MKDIVKSQLAKRERVREAKRRAIVTSASYSQRGMRARVLIDGEYYDVDERRLELLLDGRTPADLELTPVSEDPADPPA
jgi:hypothetical protein